MCAVLSMMAGAWYCIRGVGMFFAPDPSELPPYP